MATSILGLPEIQGADYLDPDVFNEAFAKIDPLGRAYVTARGTSGNWYWRRWSDGRYECWQRIALNVTTNKTSGNGFRSASDYTYTFPVTFAEAPMVVCSPISGSNTLWASLRSVATNKFVMFYMSFDNVTHSGAGCNVHVSGRVS